MVTYRFKVTFEDYDDVYRDIEIRSVQNFDDLHYAIHTAIGFDASKPATFYYSDDIWKKGKEIATNEPFDSGSEKRLILKNARLCDFITDPHQKIFYIFDPNSPWIFHVELIKINREEEMGASYPRCVKTVGEAPKQYQSTNIAALPVPEDFDPLADVEMDEEIGEEETEELEIPESDLPEGEEKDTFMAVDLDGAPEEDFETADDDSMDDVDESEREEF